MKTKEELNALKEEVETLNNQRRMLTEEELAQVSGGAFTDRYDIQCPICKNIGATRRAKGLFMCDSNPDHIFFVS